MIFIELPPAGSNLVSCKFLSAPVLPVENQDTATILRPREPEEETLYREANRNGKLVYEKLK